MASSNNRRVVTLQQLTKSGIAESLAEQALALYEKHYEVDAIGFDMATIREILFRIGVRHKIKECQPIYESVKDVTDILQSMGFSSRICDIALVKYRDFVSNKLPSTPITVLSYHLETVAKLALLSRGDNAQLPRQRRLSKSFQVQPMESAESKNPDEQSNIPISRRSSTSSRRGSHSSDSQSVIGFTRARSNGFSTLDTDPLELEDNDSTDLEEVEHGGYLWKRSSKFESKWQKRWFVLHEGELQYFKSRGQAHDYFADTKNRYGDHSHRKGYIGPITQCEVGKVNLFKHKFVISIITPMQRTYLLRANNASDYKQWDDALSCYQTDRLYTYSQRPEPQPSLKRCSSSFRSVNSNTCSMSSSFSSLKSKSLSAMDYRIDRSSLESESISPATFCPLKPGKSLSLQESKRQRLITQILDDNQECADCGRPHPQWVAVNIGVVVCDDCCAIHRSLGSEISNIQSLKCGASDITTKTLQCIVNLGGNDVLNPKLLEYLLSPWKKISYLSVTGKQRAEFIFFKYMTKGYLKSTLSSYDGDSKSSKNYKSSKSGKDIDRVLFDSVRQNDLFGIIFSILNGADIDLTFEHCNNRNALQFAILEGFEEAAELLINNNASEIVQI